MLFVCSEAHEVTLGRFNWSTSWQMMCESPSRALLSAPPFSTDPYWELLMPKLHGNSSGQNENVTCWQWARFFESLKDHMNTLLDMQRQKRMRSKVVLKWEMKEKALSRSHFNKKPLIFFVSLSSLPSAGETSEGNFSNIMWQLEWVQLGEVFDFTMFKKKNVWRDCVWTAPRGEWLALSEVGRRPCWSEQTSMSVFSWYLVGWEVMQMSLWAASAHATPMTFTLTLSLTSRLRSRKSLTSTELPKLTWCCKHSP